jgi:hypothetical protein
MQNSRSGIEAMSILVPERDNRQVTNHVTIACRTPAVRSFGTNWLLDLQIKAGLNQLNGEETVERKPYDRR